MAPIHAVVVPDGARARGVWHAAQVTQPVFADVDPTTWRRSDFPVLRPVPLRWNDDDAYGHVNNAVHYLLFDTAVNGWLVEATDTDIRRLPAIGIVAETGC